VTDQHPPATITPVVGDQRIPRHLPGRLAITLWDFSWYTQAGPEEPFHDLDNAFAEATERGYNTVRICAMPFLLSSQHTFPANELSIARLGADFGQRTRWYNVDGGHALDPRSWLLELFRAAKRHDCFVIVSSWEYQQSPSFSATSEWFDALRAIPAAQRPAVMADALIELLNELANHDLLDRVAYTELHNEADNSSLMPSSDHNHHYRRLQQPATDALNAIRAKHPDLLHTVSWGETWPLEFDDLPQDLDVAHFHFYVYGVLGALYKRLGLGHGTNPRPDVEFPSPELASILMPDAPAYRDYHPAQTWRGQATGISRELFYAHDWVDVTKWDLWLYEHYPTHRIAMRQQLDHWVEAVAGWATARDIPAVIGEGYLGYTPLHAGFEEGPVGKDIIEHTLERARQTGYWGAILCSNAAPHHPFWADITWQQEANERFLRGN
jgi:hypothetical protein